MREIERNSHNKLIDEERKLCFKIRVSYEVKEVNIIYIFFKLTAQVGNFIFLFLNFFEPLNDFKMIKL